MQEWYWMGLEAKHYAEMMCLLYKLGYSSYTTDMRNLGYVTLLIIWIRIRVAEFTNASRIFLPFLPDLLTWSIAN